MPLVLSLASITAHDLSRVGGKAANLGELLRAGFPVPPGFAITTAAYDQVVRTNDLATLIAATSVESGGAALREAFASAAIPPDLETAILRAYRIMGSGAVAVRSSATAEDLPNAAFAGQQDTYLGIQDEAALLDAVRRCWGSLWSDRALSYRAQQGFAALPVKLAVVVQRMISADAAGVLFTANPITGARNETVIDASTGLGEAIVSGLVTPDHVILRKGLLGWKIVERTQGRREVEIRARAGGGVEEVQGSGEGPAVPDSTLRQLARMGAAIAAHFARPQDIEWAWASGRIYALQSRPITALPPEPRRALFGMPAGGPTEYFQVRPYPLDVTTWTPRMFQAIGRMLPLGNALPPLDSLWDEADGIAVRMRGIPEIRKSPDLFLMPLRLIALAIQHDPRDWRNDPDLHAALRQVQELREQDVSTRSWSQLLAMADEALGIPDEVVEMRSRYFPRTIFALLGLRLLLGLIGREQQFGVLLSGFPNKTLEANQALEALAADVRATPQLAAAFANDDVSTLRTVLEQFPAGRAFNDRLAAFLRAYGHRELASPMLISQPVWVDSPTAVLGMIKSLAAGDAPARREPTTWQEARDEILALPDMAFPPLRWAFTHLLESARRFPSLREDTHFYMTMPVPILRGIFQEMGRRLTDIGVLTQPNDIFNLRYPELQSLAHPWPPSAETQERLAAAVRARIAKREELGETPEMPPLPATVSTEDAADAIARGTPGSPGVAEGPVRIVRGPADFGSLLPGEVLVAPFTNPAWTPLFGRIAAVIVDAGSAMSHAAIVAREYGVPAVMGTGNAIANLRNGQLVRVDGTRGLVFPVEDAG